jgi:hypothetical protein
VAGFVGGVESGVRDIAVSICPEAAEGLDTLPTVERPERFLAIFINRIAKMTQGCDGTCRHLKLARFVFNEWADTDAAVALLFEDFRHISAWLQPSYRWCKSIDLLVNPRTRSDGMESISIQIFMRWFSPTVLLLTSSAQLMLMTETRLGVLTTNGWNVAKVTRHVDCASLVGAFTAASVAAIQTGFCFARKHQYLLGAREKQGEEKLVKALKREANELGRQGWAEAWGVLKYSCDFLKIVADLYAAKKIANRISILGACCAVCSTWKELWPHERKKPTATA